MFTLNRLIAGAGLVCFLLWIVHPSVLMWWHSRGDLPAAAAPDPASVDQWLAIPETTPDTVWASGWDIDVWVLPPRPRQWTAVGVQSPGAKPFASRQQDILADLQPYVSILGTLYAPAARLPSATSTLPNWSDAEDDTLAAFDHYWETMNNGRALVVAVPEGSEPLLPAMLETIDALPEMDRSRFAGVVKLGQPKVSEFPLADCDDAPEPPCTLTLPFSEPQSLSAFVVRGPPSGINGLRPINDADVRVRLDQHRGRILDWLETSVTKPAEPFGGFEVIETAPIRRPGEVDDPLKN